ncbi:MAG: AraC family transcriptional regulator [Polyangiaceae bacterium]
MLVSDRSLSQASAEHWRRRANEVLTSDDVASKRVGPRPPATWAAILRQLEELSRSPTPAPEWWTPGTAFFGSVETRTDPSTYHWDGMTRLGRRDNPLFFFQFTLAGWGEYQSYGHAPQQVPPGTGFFAILPSEHRYYLPKDSPGWTFGWIGIYHPYLLERVTRQAAETGPLVETPPDGTLTACALRLVQGAIKKDFPDRYAVELSLFEFVLAYERSIHLARDRSGERTRLLDWVRTRVTASLPRALTVDEFAAEHGMTRSHFSHYFHERTGVTPARFAMEVRIHKATRMLVETKAPLKQIADACGFSDANHFCKVFRRFQHISPTSYRNAVR